MNANDDGNAQWLKQPQYCIDVVDLGGLNTALFLSSISISKKRWHIPTLLLTFSSLDF